jgi:glycosyltransferase involved in cell wall biosynthesis
VKVAHVIQSIDPKLGGPSAVVMRLAREQASLGAEVTIVTALSGNARQCFDDWVAQLGPCANVNLVLWPRGWLHTFFIGSPVRELHGKNDIVHLHGVWDSLVSRCLSAHVRESARIVLAPHGMLSSWSLQQKKLKKRLVLGLWMRSALMRVDRFHALNGAERLELRALMSNATICVVPNGTDLPMQGQPFSELAPAAVRPSERKYILFLARLHHMKGPDRLIDAFARGLRTRSLPQELELVIAGPDFGMLSELRERAAKLDVVDRVKFPGAVFGAEKEALLNGAAALCQPSRHEGFSLTLLEALAHGIPVVTTPESNFPEVTAAGCGLVVDGDDVEALSSALSSVVADHALRERMSAAGRLLVTQHYTWRTIAAQSLNVYTQCNGIVIDVADADRLSTARTGQ